MNRKIFTGISGFRKVIVAAVFVAASAVHAVAQTAPGWTYGYVPTTAQWNAVFSGKQDYLGAPPLLVTGGTMIGKLTTAPSNTTNAGINLPAGAAPSSPTNGDLWTTSAGLFARINGTTIGPFSSAAAGSFAATSPITIAFGGGLTTYACPTCGVTGSPLSQFAATTSAQFRGVISDGTGTGVAVFNSAPTIISPVITTTFTATGLVGLTNLATQSANTVVLNGTSGAASPTAYAMSGCTGPANAIQWTTNTGFTCGVITAAASSVAIGVTTITSGTTTRVLFDNAGSLGEYVITGTGNVAMSASPTFTGTITAAAATFSGTTNYTGAFQISGASQTFPASGLLVGTTDTQTLSGKTLTAPIMTTPTLGVASGTSIALGGCTIGTAAICASGTVAITSSSATALAVGSNGATNPALLIDASTASSATGIKIKSAAAAAGIALSVISSGSNENLAIDALGTGTVTIGGTSTGAITLTRATTISAALTYGGVTFANTSTGSGSLVGSISPSFTGTLAAATATFSSTVTITSPSASALAVGLTGATNPAFSVDASTASQAAGLSVKGAATGGTVAIAAIDSGANANITLNAKGSGTIGIGSVSTGAVTITPALTLSAALTYGGVTLANSVTGTGSMALSISPTITGHMTVEGVTATGATGTGKFVFDGSPTINNLTVTSAFTATGLVTFADMATAGVATTANYLAGAASVLVPASVIYTAETTTTFGATTTFDFNTFINTAVTLTANITTQTLSNVTAGKAGSITYIQDATGSRTSVFNSIFKFAGGTTPTLSVAPNAVDVLFYSCRSATNCPASLVKDVR